MSGERAPTPDECWQRAVAAYQSGRMQEARFALQPLLNAGCRVPEVFVLGGLVEVAHEQWTSARRLLHEALRLQPQRSDACLALGNVELMLRHFDAAAAAFHVVLEQSPGHAVAMHNLGVVQEEAGQFLLALEWFDAALDADPGHGEARVARARILGRLNRLEDAHSAYEDLLLRRPGDPALRLELAELLERGNRIDDAAQRMPPARELAVPEASARAEALRARLLERSGDPEGALMILYEAHDATGSDVLGFRIGRILDRLERPDEAMDWFERANNARAGEPRIQRIRATTDYAEYLDERLARGFPLGHESPRPVTGRTPLFIVGLPRSGTTLLGRMLAAHPRVQVLEELEALHAAEKVLDRSGDSAAARDAYWDHVMARVELDTSCCVVDRYPHNASSLDTLGRIFPDATVVYMLRHPLDAALGCYMQDFVVTRANVNFLDQACTGAICRRLLGVMAAFEADRPRHVLRVHHQALVDDPHGQAERVLARLGLEWDAAVTDYARISAASGLINSASYEQVTRGLDRGTGERWRRYARRIGPIRCALGEVVSWWGYADDAGG